jgi:very-short-patch-repair endonuclease
VLELAYRQYGVVSRRQLLAMGYTVGQIKARVKAGWLLPVHRGIFSVGRYIDSPRAWRMAAVLLSGPGSALARRSGAAHWGFASDRAPIETVRDYNRYPQRAVSGMQIGDRSLLVHRSRLLPDEEVTVHLGIPVTTVPRVLLDMAGDIKLPELASFFREADRKGLIDTDSLARVLDRGPGWRGLRNLRRLADLRRADDSRTKTDMEVAFLKLCRESGIASPEVNVPLLNFEVDCLWRRERIVVELDSYGFHHQRPVFESDRERDIVLRQNNYEVLRFTYWNLETKPQWVIASLRQVFTKVGAS